MNNNTDTEIKKAKRAYFREWRMKNPERIARIQERYWQRKVAEIRSREQDAKADSCK